ncbi:hypothetical protein [Haliangium sp.]|uniref:hypothetical protein n=1 Tax=Haliangium sp. TaxID=2663208 RepID=UPI003D0F896C
MADKHAVTLESLSERLDRIERTLTRLDQVLAQAPAVVATVTDVADELAARSVEAGVLPEERVTEAVRLIERMTQPRTLQALDRIMAHVDTLGEATDLAAQAAPTAAMVGDIVDEWALRAADQGIELDDRVRRSLHLVERITEPKVTDALEAVLTRIERVQILVEQLDALPAAVATVVDVADELLLAAAERGFDIETIVRTGIDILGRFGRLLQSQEFQGVLDSGVLEPRVVGIIGQLGQALSDARAEAMGKAGWLSVFRATRDTHVQRTLDFGVRFLRHLGNRLDQANGQVSDLAIEPTARKELPHV